MSKLTHVLTFAALFGGALLITATAPAQTTWYVDDDTCPGEGSGTPEDPFCSIQRAINEAAVAGDEIVVAPGTYHEAIDFLGKAIYLHSSDGPDTTIIDASELYASAVTCGSAEGPDTILEGFTITGGSGGPCGPDATCGGGMFNESSSPTVTNCTFSENTAGSGGGMYNYSTENARLDNCTFIGNAAILGGGMCNDCGSEPRATNCTFSGNTAYCGGGMCNLSSSPAVMNCTFSGNTVIYGDPLHWDGGGIYNASSSPVVTNCTFSGNSAARGGGICNYDHSSPQITNSAFTANRRGGMFNYVYSSPTVTNCTFSGHPRHGAVNNYDYCSPALANCIFWGNAGGEIVNDDTSAPTVTYSDVQGGYEGTGNIDANPLFVDPSNGDFRLASGSPCVDAGDNSVVPADTLDLDGDGDTDEPIPFDLDGRPRFVDDPDTPDSGEGDPPIVDMGAYEHQCFGDLDGDDDVDLSDLATLLAHCGMTSGATHEDGDLDGDGDVDLSDLAALLAVYGTTCP
jgi:hypothetical protein